MTRWAAFAGIALAVLGLLLLLARASQSLVTGEPVAGCDEPCPASGGPASSSDEFRWLDDLGDGAGHLGVREADPPRRASRAESVTTPGSRRPSGSQLSTFALLANVGVSHALFAALLLGAVWLTGVPLSALGVTAEPSSTGAPAVVAGVAIGLGVSLANALAGGLADAFGVDPGRELRELLAPETPGEWVLLLVVVLPTIAFFEELLFRGALVGVFAVGFGVSPWLLAVLSSVAFALGHGAQGGLGVVVTGLLGFVLATAFVLTGSLLVVVVAHYLVNAVEFVVVEGFDWEPFGWSRG